MMLQHKYGCLPVVDASGGLLGILTEADLVRYAQYLIDGAGPARDGRRVRRLKSARDGA